MINTKKLRLIHRLSQDALAKQLGVTKQAVQQWESGKTQMSASRLLLLKMRYKNLSIYEEE